MVVVGWMEGWMEESNGVIEGGEKKNRFDLSSSSSLSPAPTPPHKTNTDTATRDAWTSASGTGKEEAKRSYVELVEGLFGEEEEERADHRVA